MNKILKPIFFVAISFFAATATIAGVKESSDQNRASVRYNPNPTYIHNKTNFTLAYVVHGSSIFNDVYGVQSNGHDVYHAGGGDDFAYIEIGKCIDYRFPDRCNAVEYLRPCVNAFYDINQVSDVYINADMTCSIKCRDGSSTSCKH